MTKQTDLQPAPADRRKRFSSVFSIICMLVSSLAIVVLVTLLISIFAKGGNFLSLEFLTCIRRTTNRSWNRHFLGRISASQSLAKVLPRFGATEH